MKGYSFFDLKQSPLKSFYKIQLYLVSYKILIPFVEIKCELP